MAMCASVVRWKCPPALGWRKLVVQLRLWRPLGTARGGISQPELSARTLLSVLVCAVASEVDVPGAFWCRMA